LTLDQLVTLRKRWMPGAEDGFRDVSELVSAIFQIGAEGESRGDVRRDSSYGRA